MTQDAQPRKTFVAVILLIPIACAGAIIARYATRSQPAETTTPVNAMPAQGAPGFTIASASPASSPFTLIAGQDNMSPNQRSLSFNLAVAMHKNADIDRALEGLAGEEGKALAGPMSEEATTIARYFRMTVQPLDEAGQPTAPASPLALMPPMSNDPMAQHAQLSGQIPVYYPPRTRQIAIDVVCTKAPSQRAHWIVGSLPKTHTATDTSLPLVTRVALSGTQNEDAPEAQSQGAPGKDTPDRQPSIVLEGVAAIVPDIDPNADPTQSHPHRAADGQLTYTHYPFDNHQPAGLPAMQFALRVSSPRANQFTNFIVGIDDVVSDWMPGNHFVNTTPGSYPRWPYPHAGAQPETFLTYGGPAYSNSMKRLQVRGRVSERYRFERLTLPAADATYDPVLRQYDVRWSTPVSATAPSGATITGLNPWRALPHTLHIPHAAAPPKREETTVFYVGVAWRGPRKRPGTFLISPALPAIENPYAPDNAFPPGHVSSLRPGISPVVMPGTWPSISGNSTADMMSRANFAQYCLPGTAPVGLAEERMSPSAQDLTKLGYEVVRFAIPIPRQKGSQSHPPIHLKSLKFDSTGEVETHQWPYTLNLPFSKRIPQAWMPKPVVVSLGGIFPRGVDGVGSSPGTAGGGAGGSAGYPGGGGHPGAPGGGYPEAGPGGPEAVIPHATKTPVHRKSHKP